MPRKSVKMLRAGRHVVLLHGKPFPIESITSDGDILVIKLEGVAEPLRRTPQAKMDVR